MTATSEEEHVNQRGGEDSEEELKGWRFNIISFLPVVTVRSLSRQFRRWTANAPFLNVVITLDVADLEADLDPLRREEERQRLRVSTFLETWRGHVSLKFNDRWILHRRYEAGREVLPRGWHWVYSVATSFTRAASLDLDLSGLASPFHWLSMPACHAPASQWECMRRLFYSLVPLQPAPVVGTRCSRRLQGLPPDYVLPANIVGLRIHDLYPNVDKNCVTRQPLLNLFLSSTAGSLRKLDLTNCHIRGSKLATLATSLGEALEELVLNKNYELSDNLCWVDPLAAALRRMCRLRVLSVSHCSLKYDDVITLAAALVHCPSFTTLDVSHNRDWDRAFMNWDGTARALPDDYGLGPNLRQMSMLEDLNISNTNLGRAGTASLFTNLSAMNSIQLAKFKVLNVSGLDFEREACTALQDLLLKMRGLRKLHINDLEEDAAEGMEGLLVAIAGMVNLEVLSLSRHDAHYPDRVWRALEQSLMDKTKLKQLNLHDIGMGLTGARALSRCLPTLSSLTDLNLQCNSLDDKCIEVLAPALESLVDRENGTYNSVVFYQNRFTRSGFQTLSERVRQVCIMSINELDPLLTLPRV